LRYVAVRPDRREKSTIPTFDASTLQQFLIGLASCTNVFVKFQEIASWLISASSMDGVVVKNHGFSRFEQGNWHASTMVVEANMFWIPRDP